MNLGFDAKRLFNNYTGLGNYSRTLLQNLALQYPSDQYHLYTPEVQTNTETAKFQENSSFKIHTPPRKFLKSFWRSYGLSAHLEEDHIDLYHGLSHELPFGIKSKKYRSIVTIHDLIFKIYPNTCPAVDRAIYDFKFKHSCTSADHIIAISRCTKEDIVRFYNIPSDKISIAYQSCNPLFFNPSTLDKRKILDKYKLPAEYILYVGAITERKNTKTLIQAYSLISKSIRIPLVIVGKGNGYQQECRRLSAALGTEQNIYWISDLSDNQELQVVYLNATCFVYPSVYEGFGIPIVEALLSKIPVIAAETSCLPEAGGPDSLYFDPYKPEDLADKLATVLTDPTLREKMRQQGWVYASQNFSAKATTQHVHRLYQSLF